MLIEYFNEHQAAFWVTAGFVILAIEVLAFGLASGVLLFAGIGALTTGGLIWLGIVPHTWVAGIACFAVTTGASAMALWKPLKNFQGDGDITPEPTSDLIGHQFRLDESISVSKPGTTRFSGVEWRVEVDDKAGVETIDAGNKVSVVSIDAGIFRVAPAE